MQISALENILTQANILAEIGWQDMIRKQALENRSWVRGMENNQEGDSKRGGGYYKNAGDLESHLRPTLQAKSII